MAGLQRTLSLTSVLSLTLFQLNNHICIASPYHDNAVTGTPPTLRGCLLPPSPKHGEYISPLCKRGDRSAECGNTPGSLVPSGWLLKYSCDKHHTLSSEYSRHSVCDDGVWDNPLDCIKLCPPLRSSSLDIVCKYRGEEVDCARPMRPFSTASFQCKPNYRYLKWQRPEYSMLLCGRNGLWNNDLLECSPDCGVPNTYIKPLIGDGLMPAQSDFPWLAVIYRLDEFSQWSHVCSGTLISPHLVLTAAHCVTTFQGRLVDHNNITIALGKYFKDYYKNESHSVTVGARKIVIPRRYTGSISYYSQDIALVDLMTTVQVTSTIMPACVDWQRMFVFNTDISDTMGHVANWGVSKEGTGSDVVLPTTLKNIGQTDCIRSVEYVYQRFILVDKFCATTAGNNTGGLVDKGASGAGMTVVDNNLHYIVGIVSTRINSKNPFALFTDLNEHLAWLEAQKNLLDSLYTPNPKAPDAWNEDELQNIARGWGDSGGGFTLFSISQKGVCIGLIEIVGQRFILVERFCEAAGGDITGYNTTGYLHLAIAESTPETKWTNVIQPTIGGRPLNETKNATGLCAEDMRSGNDIGWGDSDGPLQTSYKAADAQIRWVGLLPKTTALML